MSTMSGWRRQGMRLGLAACVFWCAPQVVAEQQVAQAPSPAPSPVAIGAGPAAESVKTDLSVAAIVPSATQPPKVFVLVRNQGKVTLKRSFEVEFLMDGQSLGRRRIEQHLAPGEKPLSVEFTRPNPMPRGLHTFTGTADPDDEIRELDDTNNETNITVWAGPVERSSGQGKVSTKPIRRKSR